MWVFDGFWALGIFLFEPSPVVSLVISVHPIAQDVASLAGGAGGPACSPRAAAVTWLPWRGFHFATESFEVISDATMAIIFHSGSFSNYL